MGTFTASANSSWTIGYALYGNSTWNTDTNNGACQGAYQKTALSGTRVGVMVFSGADTALKGKQISKITFTITCSGAGSSGNAKVLSFCKAKYQWLQTGINGSAQVGNALGTLTGTFYSNTVTHTLSPSSNAAFFEALRAYLAEGNSTLVLYNGEKSTSTGYSTNYTRVTSITMTVTYLDATVWYYNGSTPVECAVWYCLNGVWVQCVPWYCSGGYWIQV